MLFCMIWRTLLWRTQKNNTLSTAVHPALNMSLDLCPLQNGLPHHGPRPFCWTKGLRTRLGVEYILGSYCSERWCCWSFSGSTFDTHKICSLCKERLFSFFCLWRIVIRLSQGHHDVYHTDEIYCATVVWGSQYQLHKIASDFSRDERFIENKWKLFKGEN